MGQIHRQTARAGTSLHTNRFSDNETVGQGYHSGHSMHRAATGALFLRTSLPQDQKQPWEAIKEHHRLCLTCTIFSSLQQVAASAAPDGFAAFPFRRCKVHACISFCAVDQCQPGAEG
jgi:hypothetical protein